MDYLFENLGDEKFQELCHALINSEFPNSQALPVGQPDGGRDSVVYLMKSIKKEFIVFQVKYVKNPYVKDPHKWLLDIVQKEAEKVDTLIPKGAKKYFLLTNVKGTAHLNVGAIDKMNYILENNINIPSICWWRDDISRKLESNNDVKWSYTEILNGQDVLNKFVFEKLNEHRERRESVIKAYLRDQYDLDNEVKFKQIELQNKLLDLFTDVPLDIKKIDEKNRLLTNILAKEGLYRKEKDLNAFVDDDRQLEEVGAASFILNSNIQKGVKRLLIEGGPGQGKSTISQYVCQIHRIRLLNIEREINIVPENLIKTPVRLPFKIDLRDIAAWVEKKNPYHNIISEETFSKIWQNNLESFLIAHILYHSGLSEFNSNDLVAILKLSSVLIIFDGFDEVANIKSRENIIGFINKGLSRLSENSTSIQVVITSRPAAFSGSIGFSVDMYPHFELTDITPKVTNEYVEKWIKSRKIDGRKAAEIRTLVKEKLKVPHLKDLAKSPMQLAILISLLNTRGESLPNKRTALYDSYIELFFNRESEKSLMIRDNRDLIIDIHEYIAWILHSEAELYKNSGRIDIATLIIKLTEYLEREGHDKSLAEKLFNVMKERVCALVSRVQGTFEFEVQPLREYFAAKFLYNTSPYSPTGKDFSGTKPDRFDAISKNLYWQNVSRFFAGCFDKGELPMLIDKLAELQEDEHLKFTNYPRLLTSQLLSDYVFTQYPRLLDKVVSIVISGVNLGKLVNQNNHGRSEEPIVIPLECGRDKLVIECFEQLKKFPPTDYAEELIGVINNNPTNKVELWKKYKVNYKGRDLTKWLKYAYQLGLIHQLEETELLNILYESEVDKMKRLKYIVNGNRENLINESIELKEEALNSILNDNFFYGTNDKLIKSFGALTLVFHPHFLTMPFNDSAYERSLLNIFNDIFVHRNVRKGKEIKSIFDFPSNDKIDDKILKFLNDIEQVLNSPINSWKTSIKIWEEFIEKARAHFGDCVAINIVATLSGNIKSKVKRFENYSNLDDNSISLCKRICSARMKSGNIKYWKNQLEKNKNIELLLLVYLTWATPRTLISLSGVSSKIISTLTSTEFLRLDLSLRKMNGISLFTPVQVKYLEHNFDDQISDELKYLLRNRVAYDSRNQFVYNNINSITGNLNSIIDLKLEFLVDTFLSKSGNKKLLDSIKTEYAKTGSFIMEDYVYRNRSRKKTQISISLAKIIMTNPQAYPKYLASIAENVCWRFAISQKKKVGQIAKEDNWFDLSPA